MMEQNKLMNYGFVSDDEMVPKNEKETVFTMKIVSNIIKTIGRTQLFNLLRKLEYLDENNVAKEEYVSEGYFINFPRRVKKYDVHVFVNQVLVTPKGLELIKKLVKNA